MVPMFDDAESTNDERSGITKVHFQPRPAGWASGDFEHDTIAVRPKLDATDNRLATGRPSRDVKPLVHFGDDVTTS